MSVGHRCRGYARHVWLVRKCKENMEHVASRFASKTAVCPLELMVHWSLLLRRKSYCYNDVTMMCSDRRKAVVIVTILVGIIKLSNVIQWVNLLTILRCLWCHTISFNHGIIFWHVNDVSRILGLVKLHLWHQLKLNWIQQNSSSCDRCGYCVVAESVCYHAGEWPQRHADYSSVFFFTHLTFCAHFVQRFCWDLNMINNVNCSKILS